MCNVDIVFCVRSLVSSRTNISGESPGNHTEHEMGAGLVWVSAGILRLTTWRSMGAHNLLTILLVVMHLLFAWLLKPLTLNPKPKTQNPQ